MPDATSDFTPPRPSQPTTHHALGLHNASIFEYDLSVYAKEDGEFLLLIEPGRRDGGTQIGMASFAKRIVESVGEMFGSSATIVIHEKRGSEDVWLVTHEIATPALDDKDPATVAKLTELRDNAAKGGPSLDAAVLAAIQAGELVPAGMQQRKVLVRIKPSSIAGSLRVIFAGFAEPAATPPSTELVGWAALSTQTSASSPRRGQARSLGIAA